MDKQLTTPRGIVAIRPAQEADAPAFRALRLEALRSHPDVFSADYAANERQPPAVWAERLRALGSDGMIYFAAAGDDGLIGMCRIQRGDSPKTRHSAIIASVYVQSEWRGLQIAEGLVAQCVAWSQTHGVEIIKLAVITTNAAAILTLWSRIGRRGTVCYLLALIVTAVACGASIDLLFPGAAAGVPPLTEACAEHAASWWRTVVAIAFLALLAPGLLRRAGNEAE
jgi:ribosomal protein S18 acetylase RimI-like enzyme